MNKIDNVFHFVFGLKPQTEPFHLAHYLCLASCIAVNKPEAVFFHYKYLPYGYWWDKIKGVLTLNPVETSSFIGSFRYKDASIARYRYAHLSDFIRLEVLMKYGGIYADIDTLFIQALPAGFYREKFILGKERVDTSQKAALEAGGSLCNAWIASEKDAEFAKRWLQGIYEKFDGSWSSHSTFLPYKLSKEYPGLIRVEPERSFYPFDWTPQGIAGIFINSPSGIENSYSMHLWSHLWWDPGRRDFSSFNHKKLTVNYLKYSKSTYASLARRFLPEETGFSYFRYVFEKLNLPHLSSCWF